ncbi:MAG: L-threonylcarbamoyladenylate synthase [Pseudomonadota bacterium]
MGRIRVWRQEEAVGLVAEVRALLLAGGIVALPTETFYALAVYPFERKALGRLFTLKARSPEKPVLVLVGAPEMLSQVAAAVPPAGGRLMARFWPGPLTLILPARPGLPGWLTGGTGTIGVRQPRQSVTCRLVASLGFPVTGTSANRSGRPALQDAQEVAQEFGPGVDLILDSGPCPGGLPSTIVDVTGAPPRLVRAGAVPWARLTEVVPEIVHS